jgi:hypothetical protein
MRKTWILVLLFLALGEMTFAQKFLQLEKVHSPKTRKYYAGDEITFQLNNGQWYTRVIEDVNYDQKLILFANGHIAVDSIVAFRSFNNARWSRPIGNQLFNFAIAWVVFSVIDQAVSDEPFQDIPNSSYIIPAASVATGFGLKKLFKQRTFRMVKDKYGEDRKWRLRVLDLNVK